MQNRVKHSILFIVLYLTVLIMFTLAKDFITFTYQTSYQNIFLFAFYIFFSQHIIFDDHTEEKTLKETIKNIVDINLYIVLIIMLINVFIIGSFTSSPNLSDIIYLSIQLFLILVILSMLHYVFVRKKALLAEYIYMFSIFLLYSLQYLYENNLFFLNLYQYYFKKGSLWEIGIHYGFWLLFSIIVVYIQFRHFQRRGDLCVRAKKCK